MFYKRIASVAKGVYMRILLDFPVLFAETSDKHCIEAYANGPASPKGEA
jgi:hypothetical protein